ncbi:carboxymuconolactone decarboxylase family protein [uncultured Desulfuromusa sp.]|uniref:(R)-mandelonitrile lyase n=1 Tax=uncultured Desulfuromusa sp. TaxID=219183 RepID=UPI002AA8F269|nr:carboxymuconolactone decarboxylase family protein [uncultured Desulfuromusa sp.]
MKKYTKIITTLIVVLISIVSFSQVQAEENKTLSAKEKGIIPIAAFTASGDMPKLEAALIKGLDAGLTVNEIKEILIHSYAYAGFPRALNGINNFMAVLEKRKEQGIKDEIGREATPVPADLDRTAYGHKVRNGLVGRDISKRTSGYPVFTPIIDQFLVDHLFADVFYRDVLNHQQRELVTISMLAAMTGTEPQLKSHLGVSMNVGLSKSQLEAYMAVLRQDVSAESADKAAKALNERLGISPPVEQAKPIVVTRDNQSSEGSADYFTGKVRIDTRFRAEAPARVYGANVIFEPGSRTAWHSHILGQTLIVTEGTGLVQRWGDPAETIRKGDVVWIPPHQKHWHGATPDSGMTHTAIVEHLDGKSAEWMEHVSDEQYSNNSSLNK